MDFAIMLGWFIFAGGVAMFVVEMIVRPRP